MSNNFKAFFKWARDERRRARETTIVGGKFVREYAESVKIGDTVYIIRGYPYCPDCDTILTPHMIEGLWHCNGCGTVWAPDELVDAIRNMPHIVSVRLLEKGGTDE